MADTISTFQIETARTLDDLDHLRTEFQSKMVATDLSQDMVDQFELCVYEVIANIIDHAPTPSPREEGRVRLTFTQSREKASVLLEYTGPSFDLTQQPLPNLEEHFRKGSNRGLGIYIIHTLMDYLQYNHSRGENRLVMEKSLKT